MRIRRSTFKLLTADTITVYTAQGGTFDAVVADMQRPPSGSGVGLAQHWLACYAMLSRAKTLEGLLVLRPAKREELQTRPPKYLLDELARLDVLEKRSLPELLDYISSLHLDIPDVVQDILAADAVDKEQCLVSAMRPAQRVTSIPEPLPETSQTAAETESSLVSPQPTNPAHVVPGLGKRVCEPPPEAPPLARKRYRLTKKTGPHSKTGRCEPPPTTPTFALAVAGAATAMAAAVAPSTSASDSSKNTAKRAADAAEVCAAARPKRQDEHASKTSAAELFSSDAAALPTVPGHASSASVQCDPPPVLPERGICSTCLDSLQADTAPQDKEQSSSRSSNRFCQYIFPTPEACGFDWPVATRASGVSSALSSPRGAQTTSGSQHSPHHHHHHRHHRRHHHHHHHHHHHRHQRRRCERHHRRRKPTDAIRNLRNHLVQV